MALKWPSVCWCAVKKLLTHSLTRLLVLLYSVTSELNRKRTCIELISLISFGFCRKRLAVVILQSVMVVVVHLMTMQNAMTQWRWAVTGVMWRQNSLSMAVSLTCTHQTTASSTPQDKLTLSDNIQIPAGLTRTDQLQSEDQDLVLPHGAAFFSLLYVCNVNWLQLFILTHNQANLNCYGRTTNLCVKCSWKGLGTFFLLNEHEACNSSCNFIDVLCLVAGECCSYLKQILWLINVDASSAWKVVIVSVHFVLHKLINVLTQLFNVLWQKFVVCGREMVCNGCVII